MKRLFVLLVVSLFIVLVACGTQTADGVVFKTADPRFNVGFRLFYPPAPPVEPAVVPPTATPPMTAEAQPEATVELPTVTPEPCLIKGNIAADGTKIAHSPGQANYESTVIDESKGERMFCTIMEAVAAGWRAAFR